MKVRQPRYSKEEFARQAIYEQQVRPQVEEGNSGKIVAIDIETGEFEVADDPLAAFLNTMKATDAGQFRGIEKALHALMPEIDGIEVEVSDLGEVELHIREDGVAIPARIHSEGTLRMLGLLALTGVGEAPALVGFEEPENGIHPRRTSG